jgi:D-alanyl-D-alanine carboxypeptidase
VIRRRWTAAGLLLLVGATMAPAVPAVPTLPAVSSTQAAPASDIAWEELPPTWPSPGPVTATAYVLMDADTGQILAQREPDLRLVVASTVKVLTVLTALDHVTPDTVVTVGEEVLVGGAGVGLDPGEQWRVDDLLEAIVARSGNDAARALAVHVGGSIEGFVRLMRAKADELGLRAPVIEDPSGLDDLNRLSARDLAVVTRAALADDRFRDVAVRPAVDLPELGSVETRNLLLDRYAGATGVKTGYTDLAGWCLIGSAEREGRELIAVVLDARTDEDRFADAERLLDFGFVDHVAADAPPALRTRLAGGWVDQQLPVPHVWFPGAQAGQVDVLVPVEATEPAIVSATWQTRTLAQWTAVAPGAPPSGGADSELGASLADALYRAMRSAHRAELWTADASEGG